GAAGGRAGRGAAPSGNGGDVPGLDRDRRGAAVPLHGPAAAAGAAEGPGPARLPGPVPPPAAVAVLPGLGEVPAAVRLRAVPARRGRRRGGRRQPGAGLPGPGGDRRPSGAAGPPRTGGGVVTPPRRPRAA